MRLSFAGIELAELVKILEIAENQGIGLRRDEGFGRVAFNHPVHDKNLSTWSAGAFDMSPLVLGDNTQRVNPATALIQFMLDWMKKLDDEFKSGASKFSDEQFEAVARLLHVSRKASADDVKQELDRMGKMEELLPQTLKGRDKKNFFETDGENGMKAIKRLVGEMATRLRQQGLQKPASVAYRFVQMLAAQSPNSPVRKHRNGGNHDIPSRSGNLVLRTALHVGTGDGATADDLLRHNARGRLLIPGTAIAGALRSIATGLAHVSRAVGCAMPSKPRIPRRRVDAWFVNSSAT